MKRSMISWTDYSGGDLNFVRRGRLRGDCEISEGCVNCWARAIMERFNYGPERTTCYPNKLERLRKWEPAHGETPWEFAHRNRRGGDRPLAFVCDTGDLFHPSVGDAFLLAAFDLMLHRSDIDWQILTKRPGRALEFTRSYAVNIGGALPRNIWLGVTAENQRRSNERIPILLQIPAAVRFVSLEPLLEPVDLGQWIDRDPRAGRYSCVYELPDGTVGGLGRYIIPPAPIQWVIVGAESGPNCRPFKPYWAQAIYNQCRAAGVAFFGKQDSHFRPGHPLWLTRPDNSIGPVQEFPS